ncbi:hypothetical protein ABZ990_11325 [Streptomyces sp. NPDC046203]
MTALITPVWWLLKRRLARGAVLRHRVTLQTVEELNLCAEANSRQPG